MSEAVLRVRADAAQARGEVRALGGELRGTETSTQAASSAAIQYKVALAAVAGASAVAFKRAVDYGDKLDKLTQKTGISTEILSGYALAAELAGTSQDAMAKGLVKLAQGMNEAATSGTGPAAEAFEQLGISVVGADGKLRGTDAVLRDVADKFAAMEDGATKTALASDLLGSKLGSDLIPLLNGSATALDDVRERSAAMGLVWSRDDAAAAAALNDSVSELKATVRGFTQEAARYWIPTFADVAAGAVLAAQAVLGLDQAQKRADAAKTDAQDRISAQTERVEQLKNEIHLLNFEAGAFPEYAESMLSSAAQLGTQLENEERILRNLRGELGEQAGLLQINARASQLVADAKGRETETTTTATRATREHSAAVADDTSKLDALRVAVSSAGRSAEEMIGVSLQRVQLTLTKGLEAGILTIEEFDRRMLQSTASAQAQLDAMATKSVTANEVSSVAVSSTTSSFNDLDEGVSQFTSTATGMFDLMKAGADGAKEGSEEAGIGMIQMGIKMAAQIAQMVAQAVTAATTTAATQVAANAAITVSAAPAAATQAAATYGASAAVGVPAAIAAIAAGVSGIIGLAAGIGDSGITPELFKRTQSSGHSLFVMKSGETLLSTTGTGLVERQIQITNALLANQGAANGAPANVSINVDADSRYMERAIRVRSNRRDERGLPRSNQKRYGR